MYFDRFDILSAYYLYGRDYHAGQFTREYAYMGRAESAGFRPSPWFGTQSLTENALEIYNELVRRG